VLVRSAVVCSLLVLVAGSAAAVEGAARPRNQGWVRWTDGAHARAARGTAAPVAARDPRGPVAPLEAPLPGLLGSIAWTGGGIPVCATESGQFGVRAISDNSGGVIAAWIDYRRAQYDIYAMRLDGNGNRLWPPDGFAVALTDSFIDEIVTVPDGAGGAFVVFGVTTGLDYQDVRAQHVTAAGGIASGWPANGRSSVPPGGATGYGAVSTNDGSLLMGWTDLGDQLRLVRLTGAGAVASGWTAAGLALGRAQNDGNINPVPDGAGGGYLCWAESDSVLLTRVAAAGGVAPGWTAAGKVINSGFTSFPFLGLAASPLTGGNVMVFWANFGGDPDIYAMRYDAAGTPGAAWPATGVLALGGAGYQFFPEAVSDGAGGALMVCQMTSLSPVGADSLVAQRVTGAGALAAGWTAAGVTMAKHPGKIASEPLSDGAGGALVAWTAVKSVDDDIFAQRVGGAGGIVSAWPNGGRTVCQEAADQNEVKIVTDGANGLIAVWEDYRGGTGERVYAARVLSDGTVGTQAALVSASAEPGRARLHWFSAAGAAFEAGVERAAGAGAFAEIARVRADGLGHVRYEDHDVVAGENYRYRLAMRENGATSYLGEVALRVPEGLRLALAGFVPNPVVGAPRLAYTLATGERARIEVLDTAGRRVAERELESTPGEHVVSFEGAALGPGVYVLRLTQGARSVTARAAIVR